MNIDLLRGILRNYGIIITTENQQNFINALTHTSYLNEAKEPVESYERLEFLGDSIVNSVVAMYLFEKDKSLDEGEMTVIRSNLVGASSLAKLVISLKLNECIFFSVGEKKDGGQFKENTCSDVYESIVGAIFISYGFEVVRKFIFDTLITLHLPSINKKSKTKSYKSILQEKIGTSKITYETVDEKRVENNRHEFTINVVIDGVSYGTGVGHNKKEAESNAAKDALTKQKMIDIDINIEE